MAVIGSGPSGCYTAQALRKRLADTEITVFDSLPTPYGLVRHGIAADHQGAKAVRRQFDRLFAQPGLRFVGNTEIGVDIPWNDVLDAFDAVVTATGLPQDRPLGVPTSTDARVIGAGELLRLLNADPDCRLRMCPGGLPELGERIAIVGTGNVAVDAARLLTKSDDELTNSDIDDSARDALLSRPIRSIVMISRSSEEDVKWDAAMIKELGAVSAVRLRFDGRVIADSSSPERRIDVDVHFDEVPTRIDARDGRSRVLTRRRHESSGKRIHEVDSVVSAIGFAAGEMSDGIDASHEKVFRAGGRRSGRLGNLAENRKLAAVTADEVVQYLARTPPGISSAEERCALNLPVDHVTFDGWKRIDEAEARRARPGRCRTKFSTRAELMAAVVDPEAIHVPHRLSEETRS